MTITAKIDTSSLDAALANLAGPLRVSLARSMGVAGGEVLRDEAKLLCPKDTGLLASSIYLAFKDGKSTEDRVIYSVTWNGKTAPHGHLVEFGHWHVTGGKGGTQTAWTAAKPFLRPAYDMAKGRALQAMIQRGKQRLPELLAGAKDEP